MQDCVIEKAPGWVYLLHFDEPIEHARHYIGSTADLAKRLYAHAIGRGANLTRVAFFRKIGWHIGYVGRPKGNLSHRTLEMRCKTWHTASQFCALCCEGQNRAIPGTVQYPVSLLPFKCSATVTEHVGRLRAARRDEVLGPVIIPNYEEQA